MRACQGSDYGRLSGKSAGQLLSAFSGDQSEFSHDREIVGKAIGQGAKRYGVGGAEPYAGAEVGESLRVGGWDGGNGGLCFN